VAGNQVNVVVGQCLGEDAHAKVPLQRGNYTRVIVMLARSATERCRT